MSRTARITLAAVLLAGCGRSRPSTLAADSFPAVPALPGEELALTAPGGVEIWFTGARNATDSGGNGCVERAMQIRRDSQRVSIPLLYTGSAPRIINDSTIEAPIWLHCRPGNVYQVNLRTGRPERIR